MKKVSLFVTSLFLTTSLTIYTQNSSSSKGYVMDGQETWLTEQQQHFNVVAKRAFQSVLSKVSAQIGDDSPRLPFTGRHDMDINIFERSQ
jgi:hypothetical protein